MIEKRKSFREDRAKTGPEGALRRRRTLRGDASGEHGRAGGDG